MEPPTASRPQSGLQHIHKVFSHANPRKRGYPDESVTSLATSAENELLRPDFPQEEQNQATLRRKRSRTSEWPLKNVVDSRTSPQGKAKRQPSRGQTGKKEARKRISKFQEGSLNDKPSKRPPPAFTDGEDAMERYHNQAQTEEHDDMIPNEEARPTGTFGFGRFGKAVAHVFSGFWKEKELPETTPSFTVLDERKAKAEEAYALRKAQGFKATQPPVTQDNRQSQLNVRRVVGYGDQVTLSRDSESRIVTPQPGSLATAKPSNADRLQPPLSIATSKRSVSPGSSIQTGARSSSLHLRTPSFQSLKKVKSHVHVPSISRSTDKLPDNQRQDPKPFEIPTHGLSRQPSKRDLAKQQKLSQKVSNLESKLDAARRDLERSMRDAPPVPERPVSLTHKTFTPGGLASLPSERLLTPQTTGAPIAKSNTEIYVSKLVSPETSWLASPSRQLDDELKSSCNVRSSDAHKALDAKSPDDSTPKLKIGDVDNACLVAAQAAKHRRTPSTHASNPRPSVEAKASAGVKKHRASANPKPPANLSPKSREIPPPLPPKPTAEELDRPRPDSPFLGRPAAVPSPRRSRTKVHKRKTSPPSTASTSGSKKKKTPFNIYDEEHDAALTPDSAAGNRRKAHVTKGSPAPKAVQIKAARARAVKVSLEKKGVEKRGGEKLLPVVRKEDEFEWDEDVF